MGMPNTVSITLLGAGALDPLALEAAPERTRRWRLLPRPTASALRGARLRGDALSARLFVALPVENLEQPPIVEPGSRLVGIEPWA